MSNTDIYNIPFNIEDNLGESIHLHYGQVRIDMPIKAFLDFADMILAAVYELLNLKGLVTDCLDEESLKEEWLLNYSNISEIRTNKVFLDNLYMKESYVNNRCIKRMIPLKESGYIKVLSNSSNDLAYYEEPGIYEGSRKDKLLYIYNRMQVEDYPLDNKYILIDQEGYILDGVKRASVLFNLKGGKSLITVLQINIKWKINLEERRKLADEQIEKAENLLSQSTDKNEEKYAQINREYIEYSDFCNILVRNGIKAVIIPGRKTSKPGSDVYATFIVQDFELERVQCMLKQCLSSRDPYDEYFYAYAVKRPLVYEVKEGIILISSCYCIKSKFVKVLIPADRLFQDKIWDMKRDGEMIEIIDENLMSLVIIIECLLEDGFFSDDDINILERNMLYLESAEAYNLLCTIFFRYTDKLLQSIKEKNYKKAIEGYIRFAEY